MTATAADNARLRVLLVEDSDLLRGMLGEMLDDIDGVVLAGGAAGEGAALARLENGAVDLAIVDLELNEGSGFGVLEQLSRAPERYGHARAVVFSTHAHHAIRQRCRALGAAAFFDKAEGMDELLDFVESAAKAHNPPGSPPEPPGGR